MQPGLDVGLVEIHTNIYVVCEELCESCNIFGAAGVDKLRVLC